MPVLANLNELINKILLEICKKKKQNVKPHSVNLVSKEINPTSM